VSIWLQTGCAREALGGFLLGAAGGHPTDNGNRQQRARHKSGRPFACCMGLAGAERVLVPVRNNDSRLPFCWTAFCLFMPPVGAGTDQLQIHSLWAAGNYIMVAGRTGVSGQRAIVRFR